MSEKDPPDLNEDQIKAALAEELDDVAPRRDLWPSIQEGVRRSQPRPLRRWLLPAFGSAAVLGVAVVAILLFATPLLSPEETPQVAFGATATVQSPPPPPTRPVPTPEDVVVGTPTVEPQSVGTRVQVTAEDIGGSGAYAFDPDELTFSVGETVEFTITSETEFHTFTVDELGIDEPIRGGETAVVTFTFDTAGTFELICIPHRALGMVGTITVR